MLSYKSWGKTGWCNIDRIVYESTLSRTTIDITDPGTGRKAYIRYQAVSFIVAGSETYDRLYIYLLPSHLSSFMRLAGSNGKYTEKLNELMKYGMVCIAYKNEQAFFYSLETVQPKDYAPITLAAIGKNELDQKLNSMGSWPQVSDLEKENEFLRFDIRDQARRKNNQVLQELTDRVMKIILHCYTTAPTEPIKSDERAQ